MIEIIKKIRLPFYFETDLYNDPVSTWEDWREVVALHSKDKERLKQLKSSSIIFGSKGHRKFGEGGEFTKGPSLGEWERENNLGLFNDWLFK